MPCICRDIFIFPYRLNFSKKNYAYYLHFTFSCYNLLQYVYIDIVYPISAIKKFKVLYLLMSG